MSPSESQLSEILAGFARQIGTARAAAAPLCLRGGGTKDFYGEAIEGEVLDTRAYSGVVAYEPSELVVTARCGTRLDELEAALAAQGQCLPFEPPRFGPTATVGGMVAAGLSGPARASAGAVRDHILGMRLMDASGQVLTFGGQVMKNVAGFDVSRMMAGALGVFGLILEVSFKVLPQPVAVRTLVFESDAAEALARLNAWGGQPLPVSASAWSGGLLRIRLAGASLAVQAAAARLGGETLGPAEAQCYWQDVREHADAFFAGPLPLWRLSVPSVAPAAVLDGPQLIEWGGALRWVRTEAGAPRLRAAAVAAGGHATLFRGGDKASGVFQPLSPALAAIHRRLKAQLDPQRIFNRGRMYPDL